MLSRNRIISLVYVAIIFTAGNALSAEKLNKVENNRNAEEVMFNNFEDIVEFFKEKIANACQGINDIFEVVNGNAFDFEIVIDEQGMQIFMDKLTKTHQSP